MRAVAGRRGRFALAMGIIVSSALGCTSPSENSPRVDVRTEASVYEPGTSMSSFYTSVFDFYLVVTIENRTDATVTLPTCGLETIWSIERSDGQPDAFNSTGSCASTPDIVLQPTERYVDTLYVVGSAERSGVEHDPDPEGLHRIVITSSNGPLLSNSFRIRLAR